MKSLFKDVPFILENKTLVDIGKKYSKTPAQVCLRWATQKNLVVIPKSATCGRVVINSRVRLKISKLKEKIHLNIIFLYFLKKLRYLILN